MEQNMKTSVDETFCECDEEASLCVQELIIWKLFLMG